MRLYILCLLLLPLFIGCTGDIKDYAVKNPIVYIPDWTHDSHEQSRSLGAIVLALEARKGWAIQNVDLNGVQAYVCSWGDCLPINFSVKEDGKIEVLRATQAPLSSRWERKLKYYIEELGKLFNRKRYAPTSELLGVFERYKHLVVTVQNRDTSQPETASTEESNSNTTQTVVTTVARFNNNSNQKEHEWLQIGIADLVSSFLSKLEGIKILERRSLELLLKEQAIAQTGIVDENSAPEIGKIISAESIITGGFHIIGDQIIINSRMIKTETAEILIAESVQGDLNQINVLCETVASAMAATLGYNLSEADRAKIAAHGVIMMKTLEALSKGELFFNNGDFDIARKYYKEALNIAPTDPDILKRIKDVDTELGALAVLRFDVIKAPEEYVGLGEQIADDLTTLLIQKTGLPLAERRNLEKALNEIKLSQLGLIDERTALKIGKITGASYLYCGSFKVDNGILSINTKLIDSQTSQVLLFDEVNGDVEALSILENQLIDKLVSKLTEVRINEEMAEYREQLLEGEKQIVITTTEKTIGFDTNSDQVKPESYAYLNQLAALLNEFTSYRILVIGHADYRGETAYNEDLSKRRAITVLNYLVNQRVSPSRLTSIGFGEDKPIAANTSDIGLAQNRRVEFQLITVD